ncbi:MAG TPA: dihydroorotase family protein [Candidatus Limnocylindrales bacterium]|nr:dihydroorotase family protein [Candidatus Limnocylindrales bacterium]
MIADLLIRNGTVVTSTARLAADIVANQGHIVAVARRGVLAVRASEEIDATGLYVLPGVIDDHVHFREPGMAYKEEWTSGSIAAAMGGVTMVIDMPNTRPMTASARDVEAKRALAAGRSWVDFGIFGLLGRGNSHELEAMTSAGVIGFKCFLGETTGGAVPPDDGELLATLRVTAALGRRVGFHAENDEILQQRRAELQAAGRTDARAFLESRPAIAEAEAVGRLGRFAYEAGAPVHVFHLSSREGLAAVREWRSRGVDITCEVTPHHAFLDGDEIATLGARLRVNPPVRSAAEGHRDALLDGLRDGTVDLIATDHAPHARKEKETEDIWTAASGFPGVETSLRLFLTMAVGPGLLSLEQYVRLSSEGPAKAWGLWPHKGAIHVGSDADLTLVDLDRRGVIRDAELHSKSPVTPYDGLPTRGAAVATILRGCVIMREGRLVGAPGGRSVEPDPDGWDPLDRGGAGPGRSVDAGGARS